jgi:AraC-like DNA-binding protein
MSHDAAACTAQDFQAVGLCGGPSSRLRGRTERLGYAVDYLEQALASARVDEAARLAGFSRWHFMHVFQAVVGLPVAEYVRRRRLSLAAEELEAGRSVVEAAFQWGYHSQSAFTRAFTRAFGVSPASHARAVRKGGAPLEKLARFEPRPDRGGAGGLSVSPPFAADPRTPPG